MGDEVSYLINYAEARIIIAEDEEQVDKLLDLIDETPCVKHIVYCDPRGMRKYDDPRLIDARTFDVGETVMPDTWTLGAYLFDTTGGRFALPATAPSTPDRHAPRHRSSGSANPPVGGVNSLSSRSLRSGASPAA